MLWVPSIQGMMKVTFCCAGGGGREGRRRQVGIDFDIFADKVHVEGLVGQHRSAAIRGVTQLDVILAERQY